MTATTKEPPTIECEGKHLRMAAIIIGVVMAALGVVWGINASAMTNAMTQGERVRDNVTKLDVKLAQVEERISRFDMTVEEMKEAQKRNSQLIEENNKLLHGYQQVLDTIAKDVKERKP
jgi:peptidoglycan hydrolase CwlO-like protein